MTLKYFVTSPGNYLIIGESGDTPPMCPDGSVFIEADTGKIKRCATNAWSDVNAPGAGGPGGAAWGGITGTLADQTDLQSALNAKSATGHNHAGVYDPAGSAAAAQAASEPAGTVAAHAAAADPHTGYQRESEKGVANGYASLGADGLVPSAQLPPGGGSPWTLLTSLAADAATGANVTPISLTGLVFNYEANSRYLIEFAGATRAAATTTGSGFQLDCSSAVTRVGLTWSHQLANTGTLSGGSSIADDASAGVSSGRPSANTDTPVAGMGYLITGANTGTCQLRYRSEVAAVSTVMAGFILRVTKLP